MKERIYYLRDRNNIQQLKDGTQSRGNPIAVIMTYLNREKNTVNYAIAATHPKDHFTKSRAREIVTGRLNKHPEILNGIPETGHKITEMIMRDIFSADVVGNVHISPRVRNLASDWLSYAAIPKDKLPTIPAPASVASRNEIPPPPMALTPKEFADRAAAKAYVEAVNLVRG